MMMKNPVHPGRLVKGNIDELGLSVAEAAGKLGVSRQQLHRLINGQHGVTAEMAVRLEIAFGGKADTWLAMQANHDLVQVRQRVSTLKVEPLTPKVA